MNRRLTISTLCPYTTLFRSDVMLGSIELFCLSAELESFTAAAAAAGITPAAVSRAVARLEERLQVRLFVRTTRKIRLTDGGRSEEHTSELQSRLHLVCRLLL